MAVTDAGSDAATRAIWATSQTGSGSTSSARPDAMSAPGSSPAAPTLAADDDSGAPHVQVTDAGDRYRHLVRGES